LAIESLEERTVLSTFSVTSLADSGAGSLRQAIETANTTVGADTIEFNVGVGGAQTIRLGTALPAIIDPIVIDATSQPLYAGSPLITLDGGMVLSGDGLAITQAAGSSTVRGLEIIGFPGSGIKAIGDDMGNGGNNLIADNVISGNGGHGIELSNSDSNVIAGNIIGLNAAGDTALPNTLNGIYLVSGSSFNRIGTNGDGVSDIDERNIISGNLQRGIALEGPNGGNDNNTIAGNFIGTNVRGTSSLGNDSLPLGNESDGIFINNDNNNVVGTDGSNDAFNENERNIISGNDASFRGFAEVTVAGSNNVVAGNYVGLDVTGMQSLTVTNIGIRLLGTVRVGTDANGIADLAEGNVVAGFKQIGIAMLDPGEVVTGNLVGVAADGMTRMIGLPTAVGVQAGAASPTDGSRIGGPNPVQRNIMSGLRIQKGTGIIVQGNYIGTDITGTLNLGGVLDIRADGNIVGGTAPGEGNVIRAMRVSSNNNVFYGNKIGVQANGMDAFQINTNIFAITGANNIIGGTQAGMRNLLAGGNVSMEIFGVGAMGNQIKGNFFGLDQTGENTITNTTQTTSGIRISRATGTIIGGPEPGAGNTFALPGWGIRIVDVAGTLNADKATGATIQGNRIGTNANGNVALGKPLRGIDVKNSSGIKIGGTAVGEGNVVAGFSDLGILLQSSSSNTLVQGNWVGTDVTGTIDLGGSGTLGGLGFGNSGIAVGGSNNTIGGVLPGEANTVAFNNGDGIRATPGVPIRGNLIYANTGLGINISVDTINFDGRTVNDDPDIDGVQNFPVIASAATGATTTVSGMLNSSGVAPFHLDFYANDTVDVAGLSQGQRFLGTRDVPTVGLWGPFTFPAQTVPGQFLTVTATDANGNSSEFSASFQVVTNRPPTDIALSSAMVDENSALNTVIGTLSATDPDTGETFTFSEVLDTGGKFAIVGNELRVDGTLDFEFASSHEVVIRVTDSGGLSFDKVFAVTVADVNETPKVDSAVFSIDENQPSTPLGTVNATDPDNSAEPFGRLSYVITAGDPDGLFSINSLTGALSTTGPLDFELQAVHMLTITVIDGGTPALTDTATVTVNVNDLLELSDLSGVVFNDLDNDGLFDPSDDETGIAAVTITLTGNDNLGPVNLVTTTDPDGTYAFVDLRTGTYSLTVAEPTNFLDGKETAGTLGGTVDNSQDSNTISGIVIGTDGVDATGYNFANIRPSDLLGLIWQDFNNDGEVNFGEKAIGAATVTLTGTDDRGNAVSLPAQTDADGIYMFVDLRPGDYTLSETQPVAFDDGLDVVGTVNGAPVGRNVVNDVIAGVLLDVPGSVAENYNFGERPPAASPLIEGQTAEVGFWQNKKGQALIESLNGGGSATQLSAWLSATFVNMYGDDGVGPANANDLTGMTNVEVADFYSDLFRRKKKEAVRLGLSGPVKMDAQVMAVALATYVTNETLAGLTAQSYGFLVTQNGVGTSTFNVGGVGEETDVAVLDILLNTNNTPRNSVFNDLDGDGDSDNIDVAVLDLLFATNNNSRNGVLYDLDGDGDANDAWESVLREVANDVFSAINEAEDL